MHSSVCGQEGGYEGKASRPSAAEGELLAPREADWPRRGRASGASCGKASWPAPDSNERLTCTAPLRPPGRVHESAMQPMKLSAVQKKAKRHVYSSGAAGCGGKAAPTNAKNTGQAVECPFCDRTFKQDGRLKEHMRNKHGDQPKEEPSTGESSASQEEAAVRIPKDGAAPRLVEPAATTRDTPGASSSGAGGRERGYYFQKTPKMLLGEWCQKQKQKRPQPKYKALQAMPADQGGTGSVFHARVTLADPRGDAARDTILWYRGHDARTSTEAENRAAVIALHEVMGDRRLDLILPSEFKKQWLELQQMAAEKQERARRQQLEEERRRARRPQGLGEGRGRGSAAPVYLSDEQRQNVAQLLALAPSLETHSLGGETEVRAASGGPNNSAGAEADPWPHIQERLLGMGFQIQDVAAAAPACPPDIAQCLRWLLLNVPEDRLPRRFAPQSSQVHVQVLHSATEGASPGGPVDAGPALSASPAVSVLGRDDMQRLVHCGYSVAEAEEAAAALLGGGVDAVPLWPSLLLWLHHTKLRSLGCGSFGGQEASGTTAHDGASLALDSPWEEEANDEVTAMEAIFGDAFGCTHFAGAELASVPAGSPAAGKEEEWHHGHVRVLHLDLSRALDPQLPPRLRLQLIIGPTTKYPLEPPALVLYHPGSARSSLRTLTLGACEYLHQVLAHRAGGVLHQVATWVAEEWAAGETPTPFPASEDGAGPRGAAAESSASAARAGGALLPAPSGASLPLAGSEQVPECALGQEQVVEAPSLVSTELEGIHGRSGARQVPGQHAAGGAGARRSLGGLESRDGAQESQRLLQEWRQWQQFPAHKAMRASRQRLPAFRARQAVLNAVRRGPVSVLCGATGCGKSTQVPQYILEDAVENGTGAACTIVCTQPRRVAAVGLAQRVAQERGERVGQTVGYSVRLESKTSARTRILFCTVGVLLRRLMSDPDLASAPQPPSHILVDEVHERSLDTDLLLLLLRRLLERQQARLGRGRATVKVVLMSATISKATFVDYFQGAGAQVGQVELQGFSHPVADLYLEDALEVTGVRIGRKGKYARPRAPPAGGATQGPAVRTELAAPETGGVEREKGTVYREEEAGEDEGEEEDEEEEAGRGEVVQGEEGEGLVGSRQGGAMEGSQGFQVGTEDTDEESNEETDEESDEDWEALGDDGATPGPLQLKQADKQPGPDARNEKSGGALGPASAKAPGPTKSGGAALGSAKDLSGYSSETVTSLQNASEEVVNYELLVALVRCVVHGAYATLPPRSSRCRELAELLRRVLAPVADSAGAAPRGILVFLPGQAEIGRVQRALAQRAEDRAAVVALPLHSALSGEEQQKVFQRPPAGRWKVVLSTNVAETSLTIEDIVCVIDTGRRRSMQMDNARGMTLLADGWVSQAEAKQRRGRAGRVRPGICFHLLSSTHWARLPATQEPEIERVALEELCLQVKTAFPGDRLEAQLAGALTPPPAPALARALRSLESMSALAPGEALTALGSHLARLPMSPKVGKMLLYGVLLRCLDPVLTVAAVLCASRPLFTTPPPGSEARQLAAQAKARLARGSRSDHIAMAHAFEEWRNVVDSCGPAASRQFCADNFLSGEALGQVAAARQDYLRALASLGFVPASGHGAQRLSPSSLATGASASSAALAGDQLNANAGKWRIVKSAVAAGFYPNVARVQLPQKKYVRTEHGAMEKGHEGWALRYYLQSGTRVFLHPSSVVFSASPVRAESPWLVYSERLHTSKDYLRECSEVPSLALLLLGGIVHVDAEKGRCSVDAWMHFEAPGRVAVLIQELRKQFVGVLESKLVDPDLDLSSNAVLDALCKILE